MNQLLKGENCIIEIRPFTIKKVGIIITGTEVFNGTIQDKFAPIIKEKVEQFGCVVRVTVFAMILPRIIANDKIKKREISELSHGGLCMHCETCNYPVYPFEK